MAPSPIQLLIVGAIIVLLFGASRFADLGRGLGEGIRNFKKGISDDGSGGDEKEAGDASSSDDDAAKKAKAPAATPAESKES